MVNRDFWRGRRVFLTGHTGFKGSWLALWLAEMGARVTGYALAPDGDPTLFALARVGERMDSRIGDIRDAAPLKAALHEARPEVVFHLAAQALVGEGYRDPVATFATNVMGTVHLLEAARTCPELRALVVVTSDKCYDNDESGRPLREGDPLGGHDPYSSSKACTELVSAAYRSAFLAAAGQRLATARAGNVIGGGDSSPHRLVPDLLRAFTHGQPAELRRPEGVRPWQHVLEPLAGYLALAESLYADPAAAGAWNFGPPDEACIPASELADLVVAAWPTAVRWVHPPTEFPHEAGCLRLDARAAREGLKWAPRWSLTEAVQQTVAWHLAWLAGADMQAVCCDQIRQYIDNAL